MGNARNDGLDEAGETFLISDREVDRLAMAEMAFAQWEHTRKWWRAGNLDDLGDFDDIGGSSEVA